MAKSINDEIVSKEIEKVKPDAENIDNPDKIDKFVDAETEKSILLFEKTFNEHNEKKVKRRNNTNLDCEDGVVTDTLTKIAVRGSIHSDEKVSKAAKSLKIVDNFFHSIFESK